MTRTRDPKLRMAVYVKICDHVQEHGRFPTYRQLVAKTQYKTTSAIAFHLEGLVKDGLIKSERVGYTHQYSVVGGQWMPPPTYWEYKFSLEGTVIKDQKEKPL